MCRVSVIVPIYNVEKYLPKCLESICNQTYHNVEIILVDDGSPDSCGSICEEYAKKDRRIRVIHKENGGLADARNYGLTQASGDYVAFVDSDDWIDLDMIEFLLSYCVLNNADISICTFREIYRNKTLSDESEYIGVWDNVRAIENYIMHEDKYKINTCVWNKLYKRSLLEPFPFPKGRNYEDIFFTVQHLYKAKKIVYIDKPKYNYVVEREGSIMNEGFNKRIVTDEMYLENQRNNFLRECGLTHLADVCDKNFCIKSIEVHRRVNNSNFPSKSNYKKQLENYFNISSSRLRPESLNYRDKMKIISFKISPRICDLVLNVLYRIDILT